MNSLQARLALAVLSGAAALAFVLCLHFPEALAFPYHRKIGDTVVYSDTPIFAGMETVLARSDKLLQASPIFGPRYGRRIFLTDGGWRWRVLAFQTPGAFAQTRALSETIVVNRSDVARDEVRNGRPVAGERSLSGVIAHERTHGLIRARFGLLADALYPAWLREGYCDVVAGGGSLSDEEAARLKQSGASAPALLYYDGRKRVEAILRENGGSVDRLFADPTLPPASPN